VGNLKKKSFNFKKKMAKCPNCKKKMTIANESYCNWCETKYCIACRHLEIHKCDKIDVYRNTEKLNLEKKLVKTDDIKIIKI
jgi:hypothetical protein